VAKLDPDWIAVAHVYATLAQAHAAMSVSPSLNQHAARDEAVFYQQKALDALRAAGVQG